MLFYFLLCFLFSKAARRMLFLPSRAEAHHPRELGVPYEDLMIVSRGNKRIHAWFFPRDNARYTVLYCHGNAGNISAGGRLYAVCQLLDLNLQVLIFDYQGYGRSEGRPSETNTYADARAAYEFLCRNKNIAEKNIVIWGKSLGTGVAIQLAGQKNKIRGLVLLCPFTSMLDVARNIFPALGTLAGFFLWRKPYQSLRKIGRVHCPVLMYCCILQ